jgi:hypothetical protein
MTLSTFFAITPWKKWQGYDTFDLFCHTMKVKSRHGQAFFHIHLGK